MWVPISATENEKRLKVEARRVAYVNAGLVFVLFLLLAKLGYNRLATTFYPISWSVLVSRVPILLALSAAAFVWIYFREKAKSRAV